MPLGRTSGHAWAVSAPSGSTVVSTSGSPPTAGTRIRPLLARTGEQIWQIANGDGPRQADPIKHLELPPLGTNVLNFPISTKTRLFTATGRDAWNPPLLNVYDKQTGDLLRAVALPSTVRALPMTYLHEGTQYVGVAIGSGRDPDEIVALALR